jgi:hypothetical protein
MSSEPNAAIASIGAVYFDPATGELGAEFHCAVNLGAQTGRRHFSGDTIAWWLSQPDDARAALAKEREGCSPRDACQLFATFYAGAKHLWSHATFDAVVLRSFYVEFSNDGSEPPGGLTRYGRVPWHYREARDIRTLNAIAHAVGYKVSPDVGSTERVLGPDLIPHHALGDAKRQAIYCSEMWQQITRVTR